jgi:hypothetical protein
MKIASTHRVMVRPLALLGLAWAVSLFIGVEGRCRSVRCYRRSSERPRRHADA